MMTDFVEWTPIKEPEHFFHLAIDKVIGSEGVLEITLGNIEEKNKSYTFTFSNYLVYRVLDEGDLIKTVHEFKQQPFFQVKNSSFLDWFLEESEFHRADKKELSHFGILTQNLYVEIISLAEPTISIKANT